MPENIFDTHSHYADSAFDGDRDELIADMFENGLRYAVLVSTNLDDTAQNCELAAKYDRLYAAAGIHPEFAAQMPDGYISTLRERIVSDKKIRAIGEIGLDYHYGTDDKAEQVRVFTEQVVLAKELDMPIIVHSRDACEDTMSILREYQPKGVMHCFSYSAETAKEVIKLGMYIGFTGVLTFKNAKKAHRALEVIPNDRLLLETDCPYMAPEPFRSKRSNSLMIPYTAEAAGRTKGMTAQEILDLTCANAMKFYGIG